MPVITLLNIPREHACWVSTVPFLSIATHAFFFLTTHLLTFRKPDPLQRKHTCSRHGRDGNELDWTQIKPLEAFSVQHLIFCFLERLPSMICREWGEMAVALRTIHTKGRKAVQSYARWKMLPRTCSCATKFKRLPHNCPNVVQKWFWIRFTIFVNVPNLSENCLNIKT